MKDRKVHPRQRLQKIIDESEQFIMDAESWNDNRPEESPLDCEPERVLLSMAKDAAHYWDLGYMDEANARITKLTNYAIGLED